MFNSNDLSLTLINQCIRNPMAAIIFQLPGPPWGRKVGAVQGKAILGVHGVILFSRQCSVSLLKSTLGRETAAADLNQGFIPLIRPTSWALVIKNIADIQIYLALVG